MGNFPISITDLCNYFCIGNKAIKYSSFWYFLTRFKLNISADKTNCEDRRNSFSRQ